jgi:hypothetical protein
MIAIIKIFIYNILLFNLVFAAELVKEEEFSEYNQKVSTESLGRIGDYILRTLLPLPTQQQIPN